MLYSDLRTLVILRTLRVLSTLIVLNALRFPPLPPLTAVRIISMIDKDTMAQSKKFILSEKYFLTPIAVNLIAISVMKNQVKNKFALSKFA